MPSNQYVGIFWKDIPSRQYLEFSRKIGKPCWKFTKFLVDWNFRKVCCWFALRITLFSRDFFSLCLESNQFLLIFFQEQYFPGEIQRVLSFFSLSGFLPSVLSLLNYFWKRKQHRLIHHSILLKFFNFSQKKSYERFQTIIEGQEPKSFQKKFVKTTGNFQRNLFSLKMFKPALWFELFWSLILVLCYVPGQ